MDFYWYSEGFETLKRERENGYLTDREYQYELLELKHAEREAEMRHRRNQKEYV